MSLYNLRSVRFLPFFTLLAFVLSATPVSAYSFSNNFTSPSLPPVHDEPVVTHEKVAPWITITSPENEEVVDPTEPLAVSVDYEALHFNFSVKDKQHSANPSSFEAIELLLDGEPVALTEFDIFSGKMGSTTFEILPDMLPEDAEEVTLQARAYSVYSSFKYTPEQYREEVKSKVNKVAAVSDEVTVRLGIDLEAVRASAQEILDTNPDGDNDNDGLTNSFEIVDLAYATQPDNEDSNDDGISDGMEDEDFDGLTNAEEQTLGTNPLVTDTDSDGLTDKEEVDTYSTNPTNEDTDSDGLSDGLEVELGTDPNNPDTDGDGIQDGDDSVEFEVSDEDTGVLVEITGKGDIKHDLSFSSLNEEPYFASAPAFISSVDITIENGESIDEATITMPFDTATLGDTDPSDLGIAYFDPETGEMEPLVDQVIDTVHNTVSGKTTHFSTYVLYDVAKMKEIFAGEFFGSVRGGGGSLVFVFDIDSSGSMSWNDPSNIRKTVAKDLIDSLEPDDKVGVVDLDSSARILQEITTDKEAAKDAVDQINSYGGTNIGAAVTTANTMLINEAEDGNKIQILLTDGEGSYNQSYTQQAADNGIVIYTIGLGSSVDENLLRSIAEDTGGAYFQVNYAPDLISVFQMLKEETKDTDGDGLSDSAETNGMRTFWGTIITTDPNNPDTDGDGLTDGEEVGNTFLGVFGRYYLYQSDPNKSDTDGDGLDDKEEKDLGTSAYLKDTDGDGLTDKEEVDADTDPLLKDTDNDGLNDSKDPNPNKWEFYIGSSNGSDIVAILTLFSSHTADGEGSSEDNVIGDLFGKHSWISVRNVSDESVDVGMFTDTPSKQALTIGSWGNRTEHKGVWYSLESRLVSKHPTSYTPRVSVSYLLDESDLETLNTYIGDNDSYGLVGGWNNCSTFASKAWNEVVPKDERVSAYGILLRTPKTLSANIQEQWPNEYSENEPIPTDISTVYYANGNEAIVKSEEWN